MLGAQEVAKILQQPIEQAEVTLYYEGGQQIPREMLLDMREAFNSQQEHGKMPEYIANKYGYAEEQDFYKARAAAEPPDTAPGGHRGPGAQQ